jgi:hypothetical protein
VTTKIVVYLDSADFSTLSGSTRDDLGIETLRNELLQLSQSPAVAFVFSAVHISEMAPIEAKHTPLAVSRSDVLASLCQRNALIAFDKLVSAELECLARSELTPLPIISNNATWFPEFDAAFSPSSCIETVGKRLTEAGGNRKMRRSWKKLYVAGNRLTPAARELLNGPEFTKLAATYPMRPQDLNILHKYAFGLATAKEAEAAFLESLRDPRWMMQWFSDHARDLHPLVEWFRGPARALKEHVNAITTKARDHASSNSGIGSATLGFWTHAQWKKMQDQMLLNIVNAELVKRKLGFGPTNDIELVDARCAGIATFVRALHSSVWNALTSQPRATRETDVLDAVHAMYAPYVTIFRADGYMGPNVRKCVQRYGTEVVTSLNELPERIRARLSALSS